MNVPKEYKDVMLTFKGMVYVPDKYYGDWKSQVVTKRAFYHKSDGYYDTKNNWIETPNGYFSVPPRYKMFYPISGEPTLLPDGWGGHRVTPDKAIEWTYCK